MANTGAGDNGTVTGKVFGVTAFSSIQDAINAVGATGTVHVLAGNYTEQLTVQKSLILVGDDGQAVTTVLAPATRVGHVDGSTAPYAWESDYLLAAYAASGTISVKVSGLTFDANGQFHNYDRFTGVFFKDVKGATAADAGLFDSTVTGFSAADHSATGVRVLGDSLLTIGNNAVSYTINGIAAYGDLGAAADPNVTISNNILDRNAAEADGDEVGITVAFGATGTVSHNTVGAGYMGVLVSSSDNVTVNGGNVISGNVAGIKTLNASHTNIAGNTVNNSTWNAIELENGSLNVVAGNTIAAADSNGIYLWNSTDADILENRISDVAAGGAGWAIALDDNSTGAEVRRNTVTDSDVGLWIGNGSDNATATNNFFTDNLIGVQVDKYDFTGYVGVLPTGTVVRENDLSSSRSGMKYISSGGAAIDASRNYFGTSDAAAVASKIDGIATVDLTPMLDNGDADSGAVGFQADYSSLTVTAAGSQTGSAGRIQEGIDLLADGLLTGGARTVHVAAGIYAENIVIDRALSLLGPNAGKTGIDPLRGDEAILLTARNDAEDTAIIDVRASNVTIAGLTIDGDNPTMGDGYDVGGVDVNAAYGIQNGPSYYGPFYAIDHLIVRNNVIKNLSWQGIYLEDTLGSHSSWNYIQNNLFQNAWEGIQTYAIHTDISYNTFDRVRSGIGIHGTNAAAEAGFVPQIGNNIINLKWNLPYPEVSVTGVGIWVNYRRGEAPDLNVHDNTINAPASLEDGKTLRGIFGQTITDDRKVTFTNNTIHGGGVLSAGYYFSNDPSNNVSIVGGVVDGVKGRGRAGRLQAPDVWRRRHTRSNRRPLH